MVRFICAISRVICKFFFVFLELMFNYSENECELAISDSIYYNLNSVRCRSQSKFSVHSSCQVCHEHV